MKGNLLIVDDQADIRKLIRMTLEFEGYTLLEAQDGSEALRVAKSSKPELMLLDVMMPGEFDGFQVCEQIKNDPALAHTRIVMLTARGQQSDLERGRKAGADAYLTKPFSPLELIDTIERLASTAARA
jgi:two-component system phosphate regulon response regulator PhoB